MMKYILSCILVVLSLQLVACVAQKQTSVAPTSNVNKITNNGTIASSSKNEPTTLKPSNGTKENGTLSGGGGIFQQIKDNKDMLTRTFYVMLGVTSIVVIYFVVRAWRSKRRQNKSRKYGLLATSGADLEMEPLDRDVDDDDEMTMFERQR